MVSQYIYLLFIIIVQNTNLIFTQSHQDTKQLNEVQYLVQFGYLATNIREDGPIASFILRSESEVSNALKELQRVARIPVTGRFDNQTLEVLQRPRCGLKDTELLRNGLKRHAKRRVRKLENIARRIADKSQLRRIIYDAFQAWNDVSALQISETADYNADIQISFHIGHHGDAYPFDGPGRVLAHAFYPPPSNLTRLTLYGRERQEFNITRYGAIHFDDDEPWQVPNNRRGEVNLKAVATHEIGHSLGLYHSDHPLSIMYPYYRFDNIFDTSHVNNIILHEYDKIMLQRVYGSKPENERNTETNDKESSITIPPNKVVTKKLFLHKNEKEKYDDDNILPDPCNTEVDAVSIIRQEIFMFKGIWFWRLDMEGNLNSSPAKIINFWPDFTLLSSTPIIDAAFELKDRIYFFIGQKVFEFSERRLLSVRNITDLGIPENVQRIRLAYNWEYGLDLKYYIWSQNDYWKIDIEKMKAELDYPRSIAENWRNVPETVTAAFSWNKQLFFVGNSELYKFGSYKMRVSKGYPKPFSYFFKHCMPRVEASQSLRHKRVPNVLHNRSSHTVILCEYLIVLAQFILSYYLYAF